MGTYTLKLLDIDVAGVSKCLKRLNAPVSYEALLIDIYVDADFTNQKKAALKIRCTHEGAILTITYKLPSKGSTFICAIDTILPNEFIESTGSTARWSNIDHVTIKKRVCYQRGGYDFTIDQYQGLPALLKVKGPNKRVVRQLIKDLGLDGYTSFFKGTKSLYRRYGTTVPTVSHSFVRRLLAIIRCS